MSWTNALGAVYVTILKPILKGQSNEILYPQFFSSFEQACATDQWVKMFSFLVSFSPRYSYFNVEKLCGVKKNFYPGTSLQK